MLGLLAALGLSAIVSEPLLDVSAVAFFVPFAVSILLLGLGSDYNVFLAGRIWDEVDRRPLREAVRAAASGAGAARPDRYPRLAARAAPRASSRGDHLPGLCWWVAGGSFGAAVNREHPRVRVVALW